MPSPPGDSPCRSQKSFSGLVAPGLVLNPGQLIALGRLSGPSPKSNYRVSFGTAASHEADTAGPSRSPRAEAGAGV